MAPEPAAPTTVLPARLTYPPAADLVRFRVAHVARIGKRGVAHKVGTNPSGREQDSIRKVAKQRTDRSRSPLASYIETLVDALLPP